MHIYIIFKNQFQGYADSGGLSAKESTLFSFYLDSPEPITINSGPSN